MSTVTSFNPIADKSAQTLILGSIPSVASLKSNQYYAHPRNAFWPIMATVLHFDCGLPYQDRIEALKASGVALWDVLYSCVRPGSLDAAIKTGTRVPNDFQHFLNTHSYIRKIAFNGAEAEKSFNRYVLPSIDSKGICFVRLPSSSPAHAIHFDRKVEVWRYCLGN